MSDTLVVFPLVNDVTYLLLRSHIAAAKCITFFGLNGCKTSQK